METEEEDTHRRQKRRRNLLILWYYWHYKSRKVVTFRSQLNLEGRRRRDRCIRREALLDPDQSPWHKLYSSGNAASLITVTGMDPEAFGELLKIYKPHFDENTPWTGDCDGTKYRRLIANNSKGRGRKRIISAEASLGLVLAWYRFRGAEFILQGWFGFTGTHCNVWLRFGRRILLKSLRNHPDAKVSMPTTDEIRTLQGICMARHDALENVYSVADGLKLMLEAAPGDDVQGMYYNGWTHDHYVTNLFVFSVCGRIIACVVNAPGSLHDSTLASWGGVYEKLEQVYTECGGVCCVDSAFLANETAYLLKSAQDTTNAVTHKDFEVISQATSLRQAAEWGMRAIQSSMPRLKDRFLYEEEEKQHKERRIILELVPLLYNFRLEAVGLNQLRSTYVPNWSKDSEYIINK